VNSELSGADFDGKPFTHAVYSRNVAIPLGPAVSVRLTQVGGSVHERSTEKSCSVKPLDVAVSGFAEDRKLSNNLTSIQSDHAVSLEDSAVRPKMLHSLTALPVGSGPKKVHEALDAVCVKCRKAMRSQKLGPAKGREKEGASKQVTRLYNNLRKHVYIIVRDSQANGCWTHIEALVRRNRAGKQAKSQTAQMFADVFNYLLNADLNELGDTEALNALLDKDAVNKMSHQIAYASRHDVPFQFLRGFLLQVGLDEAVKKERKGSHEKWHPLCAFDKKPVTEPPLAKKTPSARHHASR